MRLLVVDQQLNLGGGLRFITNLLFAIKRNRPNWEIYFYCNKKELQNHINLESFENKIFVIQLKSLLPIKKHFFIFKYFIKLLKLNFFAEKLFFKSIEDSLKQEILEISIDFDLAYFPWPFLLSCPELKCPKVATFHDFNFKYFFGTQIFNEKKLIQLNSEIPKWLRETSPIVSSVFMKNELIKFYPQVSDISVVYLPSLNPSFGFYQNSVDLFEKKFSFLKNLNYILFPVHLTGHKNISNVFSALYLINRLHIRIRIILTGKNTQLIKGKCQDLGLEIDMSNDIEKIDVLGLGYVTDYEMFYLIKNSFAVINASLYEAGNGIGLDAWSLTIPVIQSNIPSFNEHLAVQGYKAFTFNPKSTISISEAIYDCLNNEEKRIEYTTQSLNVSKQYNWDITAIEYCKIFEKSIN